MTVGELADGLCDFRSDVPLAVFSRLRFVISRAGRLFKAGTTALLIPIGWPEFRHREPLTPFSHSAIRPEVFYD
jgi:hypothetical protein